VQRYIFSGAEEDQEDDDEEDDDDGEEEENSELNTSQSVDLNTSDVRFKKKKTFLRVC
jgi:hypothetical protein